MYLTFDIRPVEWVGITQGWNHSKRVLQTYIHKSADSRINLTKFTGITHKLLYTLTKNPASTGYYIPTHSGTVFKEKPAFNLNSSEFLS